MVTLAKDLEDWAYRWGIPTQALDELCRLALYINSLPDNSDDEARVQSEVRLAAAQRGKYLFRNNVGAGKLASGSFVRFGLGNDSAALNERFKSADLVGWERKLITADMVGQYIAQFLSVECKHRQWKFSGDKREMAQAAWATLVNAQGGRALITNDSSNV